MQKLQKFENNAFIKGFIFLLLFVSWFIPFQFGSEYQTYGVIFQMVSIILAAIFLLLFKNTVYILEIILLFPFSFAHTMDLYTIPKYLFVGVGILIVSFIIHLIIYKPKYKLPSFFMGFLIIAISLVTGGLSVKIENQVLKTLLLLGIAVCFLFLYLFLSNTAKLSFKDLAYLISGLGFFIILQVGVAMIKNPDFFQNKSLSLGWASNPNSFAMILLFTFPFMYYFVLKGKLFEKLIFGIMIIPFFICLLFSYSRGAVVAAALAYLIFAIILIIRKDTRKITLIYLGILLLVSGLGILIVYLKDPEVIKGLIDNLSKINLGTLNMRVPIYNKLIRNYFDKPIFGWGIYASYDPNFPDGYEWGHNTFIQTAYTLGTVGLIGVCYHHVEKYMFCFREFKMEKIFILIAFLATDFYGFIDVSYFFINFMIVLLVILIASENIFKKVDVKNE